ncbi:hypothetical protein BS78_03G411500 [Paspalum vaginatum]|nr:hypothetical protein BS78_03G411500 [Paspalum vaginatum]
MAAQATTKEGTSARSSSSIIPSESENHGNQSSSDDVSQQLPSREGWSEPLVLYKNYWLRPRFASTIARLHNNFKPRHDDTILASNPKCGTTWLKALAFAVTTQSRSRYGNDLATDHPLLSRHPQELVPFIEVPLDGDLAQLEALPSPRLLSTHMPLSMLFPDTTTIASRVVYVCREPKDAFVSRWHFENRIVKGYSVGLEAALDMFVEGFSPYGPFWDHCLEYWRASVASPDRVLFLKYEDMMAEPVMHVVKLAAFLGVPFTAEEEEAGVPEQVVGLCSFDTLSGAYRTGDFVRRNGGVVLEKSVFFRKGKVGDWVNHMTQDMGSKIDRVVEEKLKGSGLVF